LRHAPSTTRFASGPPPRAGEDYAFLDPPPFQIRHAIDLVGHRPQLFVEDDLAELLALFVERHLEVGLVEELGIGQLRGEDLAVAVDARDGMVATEGWAEVSDVPVADMARRFEDAGVASLLFTDIGRDGLLKGCNIEATVDLARHTGLPVIASGGVKGLDDIRMLALHANEGIEGVITGRALYDGRLDLATAIQMAART